MPVKVDIVFNQGLIDEVNAKLMKDFTAGAIATADAALDLVLAPKHGKQRFNKSLGHPVTQSAPGEPAASHRGDLRDAIAYNVRKTPTGIAGRVGYTPGISPGVAMAMEFGTKNQAPRPVIVPAFNMTEKSWQEALNR